MSVDLEKSLAALAGSVHDDAVAERMTGQVHHMVSRIRRRRAARHAGQGVVGVGAAAAVTFGGVQLAGRPTTAPPATQAPTEGPSPTSPTWTTSTAVCGVAPPAPVADPRAADLLLDAEVQREVPYGEAIPVSTALRSASIDGSPPITWAQATPVSLELMVVQDGLVVGSTLVVFADTRPGMNPADALITGDEYHFSTCSGGDAREPLTPEDSTLAPGDYTLVATERLVLADGTEVAVPGGPWVVTVTDPDAAAGPDEENVSADGERAAAAAELAALLAEGPRGTFPTCGSAVPADDDAPLTLDLDPALGAAPVAPGIRIGTSVDLRATGGRQVLANVPTTGAVLVVVKDGVVVGKDFRDPEDVSLLSLGTEGAVQLTLTGSMSLCTTPAQETPGLGLPAGTYEVYAVVDAMLKEITGPDGEAVSVTETIAVRSNAVTVTVE